MFKVEQNFIWKKRNEAQKTLDLTDINETIETTGNKNHTFTHQCILHEVHFSQISINNRWTKNSLGSVVCRAGRMPQKMFFLILKSC